MSDKCQRCDGRGYKKLPPGTYGMIPCTKCGGSGKDLIASIRGIRTKVINAITKEEKTTRINVQFKDVKPFETFYLYNHEYVKTNSHQANWVKENTIVECDPETWVEI